MNANIEYVNFLTNRLAEKFILPDSPFPPTLAKLSLVMKILAS